MLSLKPLGYYNLRKICGEDDFILARTELPQKRKTNVLCVNRELGIYWLLLT